MKIYLDTSVPSTYFDDRTPDRQSATRKMWSHALPQGHLYVSELVLAELKRTPTPEKRQDMVNLVEALPRLSLTAETIRLARILQQAGLVPPNKLDDAVHLAIAAVNGADALVSWNFRHMVNFNVKRHLPVILAGEGYFRQYQIIAPYEYSGA